MLVNDNCLGEYKNYSPLKLLQILGEEGDGIKLSIIDGAIDKDHSEIKNAKIILDDDFSYNVTSHGTSVCSIICGENIGISKKVSISAFSVFKENEKGELSGCSERLLSKYIRKSIEIGCDIINISGAGLSVNGRGSDELRKAVYLCEKNGVLLISAVGNDGINSESLPSSLPTVVAVGACDSNGFPASFNNYGRKLRKKMLLASGVDLPVAVKMNQYDISSGSSFSAPVVSAVCALLLNVFKNIPRERRSIVVRNILFSSACLLSIEGEIPAVIHRLSISGLISYINQHAIELLGEKKFSLLEPKIFSSSVATLKLPEIKDSASNLHVHNPSSIQAQSTTLDARTVRDLEKVFLIGTLGYDFGTEARLDYFIQVMGDKGTPYDPIEMASHLKEGDNAEQSNALIWTLKIDGIPVYAIEPDNQFAILQYARLVDFIHDQETQGIERVSIAGVITGEVRLFNGQVVPKVSPVLRGMFNWKSHDLAKLVIGGNSENASKREALSNFINRVYYELRNRGSESNERAINYAATNAYQMKEIFDDAFKENLFLNQVTAVESPVSRPDSDCWDVVLEFFNPKERLTAARKLYRYTVDVSDVMPVTVGKLRSWHAY